MTQSEWIGVVQQMRSMWPNAELGPNQRGSMAIWFNDLQTHDAAEVLAAVTAFYRDGATWPPNGAQILGKLAELKIDAPSWGEVKADLMKRAVAGSLTRERCPDDLCDGSGFVVNDDTREARACRCRDGLIARRQARRAELRATHELVVRFLEAVGPQEVEDVIAGDRTAEAQVRTKYEAFVVEEQRRITYAGIAAAGLPALERRVPRRLAEVVRELIGQAE